MLLTYSSAVFTATSMDGAPLVLPFHALLDRAPVFPESDIVLTEETLDGLLYTITTIRGTRRWANKR